MSGITRILKMPVQNLIPFRTTVQKLRFTEARLYRLFTEQNKIWVRTDFPNMIESPTFIEPLLKSLGLTSYGEAKKLVASLKNLGIKEIYVKPSVIVREKIIDKETLMSALERHREQEWHLKKMVIKNIGFRPYWIQGSDFVLAQRIGINWEKGKEEERAWLTSFVLNQMKQKPEKQTDL